MIKYGLFFVFIGLIIYEGVNAHPTSKKQTRNMARRSMYYDNKKTSDNSKENSLESIVLAIDTGVQNFMASKNKPDIVDDIAKSLVDFARKTANNPVYRSKGQDYEIRPELIRFKDEKPSLLVDINSDSIINGLKDLLRSKTVHKLMEQFSKEAAVVYRSIKNELVKGKKQSQPEQQ